MSEVVEDDLEAANKASSRADDSSPTSSPSSSSFAAITAGDLNDSSDCDTNLVEAEQGEAGEEARRRQEVEEGKKDREVSGLDNETGDGPGKGDDVSDGSAHNAKNMQGIPAPAAPAAAGEEEHQNLQQAKAGQSQNAPNVVVAEGYEENPRSVIENPQKSNKEFPQAEGGGSAGSKHVKV